MSIKLEKANMLIQKALAEIVYELNDPRLVNEMVTIHKVSISPDLKYAKVQIGIFGDKDEEAVFLAIKKASGFIRRQLAIRTDLRVIPVLDFQLNDSEEYAENIDKILKSISTSSSQSEQKNL